MKKTKGIVLFFLTFICCLAPLRVLAANLTIKDLPPVTVKAGETKKLLVPVFEGSKKLDIDHYSIYIDKVSSNKNVKGYSLWDEGYSTTYLCVTGLKAGTSEISYTVRAYSSSWNGVDDPDAKYSGKLKVTVTKNKKLSLSGYTPGYIPRTRTYKLKITNHSYKTVEILPAGAKAVHRRKKSYNRNMTLKGGKKKIKPGATKKLTFTVRGKLNDSTGYEDYNLVFSVRFRKKTYTVMLQEGEYGCSMYLKKGSKWKLMTYRISD